MISRNSLYFLDVLKYAVTSTFHYLRGYFMLVFFLFAFHYFKYREVMLLVRGYICYVICKETLEVEREIMYFSWVFIIKLLFSIKIHKYKKKQRRGDYLKCSIHYVPGTKLFLCKMITNHIVKFYIVSICTFTFPKT